MIPLYKPMAFSLCSASALVLLTNLSLLSALVQSHLEYCTQIWGCLNGKDMDMLE